jgi:ADP-heptose:LPS heptosyltransferase
LENVPVQSAAEQAVALAGRLLMALQNTGEAPRQALEQLCARAVAEDPAIERAGSQALFQRIVEPLGDSFDPAADPLYVHFFSGVIDYCRRLEGFRAFDRGLRSFGLETNQQFLDRAKRIRSPRKYSALSNAGRQLKLVLVPSRVTLGADVAITGVILNRMKAAFPKAGMALLGSTKAGSLFAADPRVELVETSYPRGGTLRQRLEAWVTLRESVSRRLEGLLPVEYLIVDPDSRLTQLGLLPLTADEARYYFYNSRSYSSSAVQPLAQLTGCWLDEVFVPPDQQARELQERSGRPYVALPREDLARGEALRETLRGRLAAVNLGDGGNPEKRVEDPFEVEFLLGLLGEGYKVVLDRGAGEEELRRTSRLIAMLQKQGKTARPVEPLDAGTASADLFIWEGSLSGFGGLIAAADLYAGYDSAGGHLAAALGVPVIDIFPDAAPPRMRERWAPWGQGPVRIITARRSAPQEALRQVLAALREHTR